MKGGLRIKVDFPVHPRDQVCIRAQVKLSRLVQYSGPGMITADVSLQKKYINSIGL